MIPEISAGIARGKEAFKNIKTEIKHHEGDVRGKIYLSAGLNAAVLGINWGAISVFALKESGWIGNWTPINLNTSLALGISYGINIVSSLLNFNQERRLLQNERIEMSQDVLATFIYHRLGRVDFWKEKRKGRSIAAVSAPAVGSLIVSAALKESAFLSIAAISPEMMQRVVVAKSGQGFFGLFQVGVAEIALRTAGRERKKVK